MTKVIRLEPHSMAIFYKIDVDPGFAMSLCSDASLFNAVHRSMYGNNAPDSESRAEVVGIIEKLREGGNVGDVGFEDGWISLRIGMADVTAFLMEKLGEAKQEERWADKQRYEELKAKEATKEKYALLRQALVDALGDKGPEIAAKAAA
jgi:hypothetical protein